MHDRLRARATREKVVAKVLSVPMEIELICVEGGDGSQYYSRMARCALYCLWKYSLKESSARVAAYPSGGAGIRIAEHLALAKAAKKRGLPTGESVFAGAALCKDSHPGWSYQHSWCPHSR